MKRYITFFMVAIAQLSAAAQVNTQTQQQPPAAAKVDPAMAASAATADAWLKLIDQGAYDKGWDVGSFTLKLRIPLRDWKMIMDGMRKPLGTLRSRKLIEQRPAQNPNGLPKGDYMVLVYESSFSGKQSAMELLTMVQESDGQWRVLTYQVN